MSATLKRWAAENDTKTQAGLNNNITIIVKFI